MGRHLRVAACVVIATMSGATIAGAEPRTIESVAHVSRRAVRVNPPAAPTPRTTAQQAVDALNVHRVAAGLSPLAANAQVIAAAQAHADDMAAMGVLSHRGSDGSNAGTRLTRAGFTWAGWGENIASGYTDPATVVEAWLASPSHRDNMLSDHRFVGVGIAAGSDGTLYWALVVAS